ncbi:MAG: hypothetical protein K0R58_228 [Ramlibacter sp.]|jgi:hypothetical protein|nr:hypothetical protein [Ramlibacter sp.]
MMALALWEGFALALVYSCFCRATYTTKANTRRDIRWAFTGLGVMAWLSVLAPLWGYEPDGFALALLVTMTAVQITTSHHWRKGIPAQFRRDT